MTRRLLIVVYLLCWCVLSSSVASSALQSAPTITSLSPTLGPVSTSVTITGTNFGTSQGSSTVTFDAVTATPSSWSNTQIVALVPPQTNTGSVVVTVGGIASNGVSFIVTPSIAVLRPAQGAVGSQVAIDGEAFGATQGSSTITINGTAATVDSWTNTRIVIVIPSGATTGNTVVTVAGEASNAVTFTVVPPPSISSVSPATGVAGTSVTISGNYFGPTQGVVGDVTFGGVSCGCFPVWSNTTIQATVPAGARTGNVVVTVPGGVTSNGVLFSVPPLITSLSPSVGSVGSPVTITGTEFGSTQGSSTVTFGGIAATPTSWSDTSIVVPVPSGAATGPVVVTAAGLASSGMLFSVPPVVGSVSPTTGVVGTSVTITGSAFGATQGSSTVTFNGAAATPTSWSNTSIVVPVPSGAVSGNVIVTVAGLPSNGVPFTVIPAIGSLSPTSGAAGTSVTVNGTGFGPSQGPSTVTFNNAVATPTSWSSSSIVVPVPAGASTGNVVVTVGSVASNGVSFTVVPNISSLSPASGSAGASVTILGSGFGSTQGTSTVTFNGTPATAASWSNTQIAALVPNGVSTGNVVVTVGGNASNGVSFTTTLGIGTLSPNSGPVGASVTISGTGFGATQGSSTVTFNGTAATTTSWSNAQIVTPVPSAATTGPVIVTVGSSTSNGISFTVTPGISSLSPTSGPAGSSVTITGTSFGSAQGSSTVAFNGTAATTTSWGSTQIVALVPNGATSGNVLVTVGGNASNGVSFTPTLGIGSESPTSGPVGTYVTINGTGFGATQGSSTVTFNSTTATPISWSNGSIVVQVPSGATTGSLLVTVAGSNSNGVNFTVTTAPVVQSNSGFSSGVVSTSVPFLSNNSAGNLLWVAVGGGSSITAPTDTLGNTYTLAATAAGSGASGNAAIYYAVSGQSGANTVTCNQSVADDIHCHIAEITGLAPMPLDQTGSVVASSTCSVSTSGATTATNEWVGAFFYDSSGDPTLTAGTGYSTVQLSTNSSGDAALSEGETATSTGVQTATCSGNSSTALAQLITTFQPASSVPIPAINSLTPNSGPVGSSVRIAGSNFGTIQGTGGVTFNGVVASVTSWSSTSITAVVPAGASTGNAVVTAAGVSSGGVTFTVVPPPSISTLTPASGPVGSSVVIAGSNLGSTQGGSTVSFNGTVASVTAWSSSSITAVVPAGASSGNVVVTTAGGVSSAALYFTVVSTPVISSLTPSTGATGSSVTIAGTNFGAIQGNGTVTFNGTPVTLLTWSGTSIVAQVPATATTGNVVVTASGGVSSAGVSFTVLPAPLITSIAPISAPVGTQVTINGNNFGSTQSTSTVTFNGVAAAARGRLAVSWSNTAVVVNVPSGATTGNVVVTVGGKASNAVPFAVSTYISGISPASGPVGSVVTVNGGGFGQTQGSSTVTFNGGAAVPTIWSNSSIQVPAPSGVTTGNVVVTVSNVASNGVLFTAAPVISSLSASTLAVGSALTITGLNFGTSPGTVTFNGTAGQPTSWSSTSIVVPVPIGATPGNVVVTANGMSSNGINFTPGPFVSALSLTTSAVGTPITITGGNFGSSQGSSTLTFNGLAGTPSSWSNTQIIVPVPLGATPGNLVVTVNGLASNSVLFTPGPSITSLNLVTGLTGTSVTINGTNFGSSQGTSTLTFNGTAATAITQWGTGQIVAVVPGAATTGNVVVTVNGIASNGVSFTVLPAITTVSPTTGITGTTVTINGSGFGVTQGTSTVSFNGTQASPTSWGITQIVVPVPTTATTGSVVVTVNGTASNAVNFTVIPAISSLAPTSGGVGTQVSINGTGFANSQGSSTLTFNGTAVTPSVWSDAQIVFTVPTGATTGNVVVTVAGNASNPTSFTVTQGQAGARSALTSFVASDGSIHSFYVGPDQHVYHLFWNSTNNWQYQDLTDITSSSLVATGSGLTSFTDAGGSYHLAYVDINNHLDQFLWFDGAWVHEDLTVASGSSGAASNSQLTGFTDAAGNQVYYLGANQHEYELNAFNRVSQDLTTLSGATVLPSSGSVLTSFSLSDGSEHSFYLGTNQHIYQTLYVSETEYFNQDLTYTAALNLSAGACAQQGGTCTVTGTTTVGFGANGAWNFLTVNSNVACNVATFGDPAPGVTKECYYVNTTFPVAALGSALTSFNDSSGDHVYYLDSNGHNHELALAGDPGKVSAPWVDQDQTKNSGTTSVAVSGSALTSFPTSDNNQHLIYFDTNHNVDQMLYETNNQVWVNQDLTTASGATVTAGSGSGLTSFTLSTGNPQNVQYLDTNGHINQLSLNSANAWQNQDLTAIATNVGALVPGIGSLSPISGPVGTTVTINGANFGATQGSSTVTFNGVPTTPTTWSNTQIVAVVPTGATTGNVIVTVNSLASNGVSFDVTANIGNLSPPFGPVGTMVTISGINFGATQGTSTVSFNGTPAAPTSWSDNQIVVPVPAAATSGNVVVTVGGVAGNSGSFSVSPVISGLSPTSALIGTPVTITGTTFGGSQGSSTVTFNGTAGTPTSWSSSSIVVPVPNGATSGSVVVTVGGVASNGAAFTVTNPLITNLSPPAGLVGSSFSISGVNFGSSQSGSTVTFGGQQVAPTSWSANAIGIVVPSNASLGNNNVNVSVGGVTTNTVTFIVTSTAPPTISSLSTNTGAAGSAVTINGSNFGSSGTVTFNGVTASVTSWSANSVTVVVPSSATTGPVAVTVSGVPSNSTPFQVIPLPQILVVLFGGNAVAGMGFVISGQNITTNPTVVLAGPPPIATIPLTVLALQATGGITCPSQTQCITVQVPQGTTASGPYTLSLTTPGIAPAQAATSPFTLQNLNNYQCPAPP